MTVEVKIIEDSISPTRARITTFQLRYPRMIHAEFMTHRLFSRNASSSRAVPVRRILAAIQNDPVIPIHWGKNQKGMQAGEEVDPLTAQICETVWLEACRAMLEKAKVLSDMGIHKQVVNRLLEPWSHISVVVTATEYDNFFSLRCHPDAAPTMRLLAETMRDLYFANTPRRLSIGEWHLPYIKDEEKLAPGNYTNRGILKNESALVKASVARCARVSYLTHDKKTPSIENDIELYGRLFDSKHMSAFEHLATPLANPHEQSGNFKGWCQYRKCLKGEQITRYIWPLPPKVIEEETNG